MKSLPEPFYVLKNDKIKDEIKKINNDPLYYEGDKLKISYILRKYHIEIFEAIPSDMGEVLCCAIVRKVKGNRWEIFINKDSPLLRKRFSIAHEIGHIISYNNKSLSYKLLKNNDNSLKEHVIFHRNNISNMACKERYNIELQANEIAGCLLMPESKVKQFAEEELEVYEMSQRFQVSEAAMTVRLYNLGLSIIL